MFVSSPVSPASASALLARLNLGCIAATIPRSHPLRHCRNASILAHHKIHANTKVRTQLQPLGGTAPSILRGYPVHAPKGEPMFIDPLQFILKDVISPPQPLATSTAHAEEQLRFKTQRVFSLDKIADSLSSQKMPMSQKFLGTVVSEACSSRGERTIEVDVTPAQLHSILLMQKRNTPKRP
ncbi:hypothetical protein LPJ64_003382, partial [Coemansia asiatica]